MRRERSSRERCLCCNQYLPETAAEKKAREATWKEKYVVGAKVKRDLRRKEIGTIIEIEDDWITAEFSDLSLKGGRWLRSGPWYQFYLEEDLS